MTTKLKILLPLMGSLFFVSALVIAFWMIGSASGERDKFSSLEIAPAEADVYFAINTDPTSPQWLAVNSSLESIGAKDPIRKAIDEALADVNLDWEDDIVPIAGDEAFVSIPDLEEVGDDGGFVAGFRLRDEEGAREVFEKLRETSEEEDGEEFQEEEYEGVTIFYTEPMGFDDEDGVLLEEDDIFFECYVAGEDNPSEECAPIFDCPWYTEDTADDTNFEDEDENDVPDGCEVEPFFADPEGDSGVIVIEDTIGSSGGAVAIFDNVMALGATPDDVKPVIDVVQGREPSAETNERLIEFREAQKEDFLMWGYVDLASVWDIAEDFPSDFGFGEMEIEEGPAFPPEDPYTDAPQPTDFTITQFESDITFGDTGFGETGMIVTETISIDFGTNQHHGIFRDISDYLPYDDESEEWIYSSPISVLQDGEDAQFEVLFPYGTTRIKIGDPDVLISGEHVYTIQYSTGGGVRPVDDGSIYEIYWPITGDSWGVPINIASGNLTLPEGGQILTMSCYEGPPEANVNCSVGTDPAIPNSGSFEASGVLAPGSDMTIVATVTGDFSFAEPFILPKEFGSGFDEDDEEEDDEPEFDPFQDVDFSETIEDLRGQFDRAGFSISSFDDGFAVDFTILQAPDYEAAYEWQPSEEFDPHFAESVPEDTMFFLAMNTFYEQGYEQFREQLDGLSEAEHDSYNDFIEMIEDEIGINIETDLLALLTGETAVAGNVSGFDQDVVDVEVVGLADVDDDAKATETLEKLGDYLEGEGVIETDERDGVNLWQEPGGARSNAIGWSVQDGVAAISYPWELADDREPPEESLAGTRDWQRTLDLLPSDGIFVGYLSIARILEEIRAVPDAEESFEESTDGEVTLDDLDPIRALGYSATIRENGFGYHIVLFMEDR